MFLDSCRDKAGIEGLDEGSDLLASRDASPTVTRLVQKSGILFQHLLGLRKINIYTFHNKIQKQPTGVYPIILSEVQFPYIYIYILYVYCVCLCARCCVPLLPKNSEFGVTRPQVQWLTQWKGVWVYLHGHRSDQGSINKIRYGISVAE